MMSRRRAAAETSALRAHLLRRDSGAALLGPWFAPTVAMALLLGALIAIHPNVFSYFGLSLLLSALFPLVLASVGQMFAIAGGDVDLSIGSFVGLVNVICAGLLGDHPVLGVLFLVGLVLVQGALGAIIAVRRLPAIIVTLGMSFVWLGLALVIMPKPGGTVPAAIVALADLSPPVVPSAVVGIVAVAVVSSLLLTRTRYGAVLRAVGGNADGLRHAGWSVPRAKVILFALLGVFGVLSGLMLSAEATSGDPNIAQSFVLLTIASVIVGGGNFATAEVSPGGTVAGALVVGLIGTLLQFLDVPSSFQVGAQGLVLVVILAVRAAGSYRRNRRLSASGAA